MRNTSVRINIGARAAARHSTYSSSGTASNSEPSHPFLSWCKLFVSFCDGISFKWSTTFDKLVNIRWEIPYPYPNFSFNIGIRTFKVKPNFPWVETEWNILYFNRFFLILLMTDQQLLHSHLLLANDNCLIRVGLCITQNHLNCQQLLKFYFRCHIEQEWILLSLDLEIWEYLILISFVHFFFLWPKNGLEFVVELADECKFVCNLRAIELLQHASSHMGP
jgi:hypothetical protein